MSTLVVLVISAVLTVSVLYYSFINWQFARFEHDDNVSVAEAVQTDRKDEIIVSVRNNGDTVYNGEVISNETMVNTFQEIAQTHPNQPVMLHGDKEVKWEHVDTVVTNLKDAGIWNVAFSSTQKLESN